MIDLHSHILPGVDDGSSDLNESIAMCRIAAADGATTLVATPHLRHSRYWNDDRSALEASYRELCGALGKEGLELEVLLGGEITVGSESVAEIDALPGGQLLTLCGSKYLLLELDWQGLGPDPLELVYEVDVLGWRPIIAHPERVSWLSEDLELASAMQENGATFQLTSMSLTGRFGSQIKERSERWLDAGLVHFVSSDAHDVKHRPPGLAAARALVAERCGDEVAEALFVGNPRCVVDDRPLPPQPSVERPGGGLGARFRRFAGRSS
ncbi:MAG: CpsB/CapC family capsule biosynthesis tyrosine phosphatase [Acidobacteriota bacterium]